MPHKTTDVEERLEIEARDEDSAVPVAEPPISQAVAQREILPPRVTLRVMRPTISFLASLILHLVVLLVLALMVMTPRVRHVVDLKAHWSSGEQLLQTFELPSQLPSDPGLSVTHTDEVLDPTPNLASLAQLTPGATAIHAPAEEPRKTSTRQLESLLAETYLPLGGGLLGRSPELRARLAQGQGGTAASEAAVERALAWLAAHQRQDGSWHFNFHGTDICRACSHPGTAMTSTGATGLVLLAFLGAGYTHQQGDYQEVVDKGLYYLTSRMLLTPQGGDLQEGTMYGHGIATLALCEAYAMTQDQALRAPAQHAVDFICSAQHTEGGWRYYPGQPGDTTVFSWQIMALKSARLANLDVPSPVIANAMRYLDSVQDNDGATYGYVKYDKKTPSPSAIGILSRMYYGWRRDDPRLSKGVLYLDSLGPSHKDMYFNYYATQVLHHYQGSYWTRWNERLREYLIRTQSTIGHENGSWHFQDPHGDVGGRLYTTAMCTMILEVYYRYMPLYDDPAIMTGF